MSKSRAELAAEYADKMWPVCEFSEQNDIAFTAYSRGYAKRDADLRPDLEKVKVALMQARAVIVWSIDKRSDLAKIEIDEAIHAVEELLRETGGEK